MLTHKAAELAAKNSKRFAEEAALAKEAHRKYEKILRYVESAAERGEFSTWAYLPGRLWTRTSNLLRCAGYRTDFRAGIIDSYIVVNW